MLQTSPPSHPTPPTTSTPVPPKPAVHVPASPEVIAGPVGPAPTPAPTTPTVIVQMPEPDAKSEMLEFGQGIVGWPLVVIVLAVLFRKEIAAKIESMTKLKGPVEAEWTREAEATVDEAAIAVAEDAAVTAQGAGPTVVATEAVELPVPSPRTSNERAYESTFEQLKKADPSAAVIFMWGVVETRLIVLGDKLNINFNRSNPSALTHHLANTGRIRPGVADVINDLRKLRNQAVHLKHLTPSDADAFFSLGCSRSHGLGQRDR